MKNLLKRTALLVFSVVLFSFTTKQKNANGGNPTDTQKFWGWERVCGDIWYNEATGECKRECKRVHYIFWIIDQEEDPVIYTVTCPTVGWGMQL